MHLKNRVVRDQIFQLLLIIYNSVINNDCKAVYPKLACSGRHKAKIKFFGIYVRHHYIIHK